MHVPFPEPVGPLGVDRTPEVVHELRPIAQLRMLHSLARRLNQMNDVRQIGEAITAELRTVIQYHNCRVHLIDDVGQMLVPIAFRGELSEYQGETFEALLIPLGKGVTGRVAQTGDSYYSPNTTKDPYAVTIPGTPDVDESLLVVPLKYGSAVIGTVALAKLGIDQFDQEDLRVLEVLASHAAVAIQNARLLESERTAARRARESEARKSAIVESALDCVIVMDERGTITEFNPAAERTFGHPKADVLGHELAEVLIPPTMRQRHREGLERYLRTGSGSVLDKRIELTGMRADGTEFPVELAVARVNFPGPALFTGYLRDITDRKHAEQEVERALQTERAATQRLRDLDDLKNTFLQAVSHDLRTPLAVVLGLALTLDRDELELSHDEHRDLTRRLASNARKLDRILTDLLDLERLMRGVVEPKTELTDIGSLVRRIVAEADFLSGRNVTVEAESAAANVDVAKVERILENLLVNAGKHTPEGSTIWVKVSKRQDDVVIIVEDDGPGVPEELREQIFEPFQQGRGEQPSPGTGIGLSLVLRFAELHGGKAWVTDRVGGGASFQVALPLGRSGVGRAPAG